jgi:hypothetical protein
VTSFGRKLLGERRKVAIANVQFNALYAVHGEEHYAGCGGLAGFYQLREIIQRLQVQTTDVYPRRRKGNEKTPEFLSRIL